jgi:hypothetical protein
MLRSFSMKSMPAALSSCQQREYPSRSRRKRHVGRITVTRWVGARGRDKALLSGAGTMASEREQGREPGIRSGKKVRPSGASSSLVPGCSGQPPR